MPAENSSPGVSLDGIAENASPSDGIAENASLSDGTSDPCSLLDGTVNNTSPSTLLDGTAENASSSILLDGSPARPTSLASDLVHDFESNAVDRPPDINKHYNSKARASSYAPCRVSNCLTIMVGGCCNNIWRSANSNASVVRKPPTRSWRPFKIPQIQAL